MGDFNKPKFANDEPLDAKLDRVDKEQKARDQKEFNRLENRKNFL